MALTAKKVYAILKRQISDMEAKLNSPVRYRGTVATADLLPLNPDIGDMYNIESKSVYGEAGMNVAWNGVVWDTMGAPIDMSLYIKSSELADWVKQQNKPTYTAEEVGALPADTKIPSKTSDLQNDSGFLTKIPDNYLSGTDKTLSVSGKAADAKTVGDKNVELLANILSKLDKNQGSENSGKIAGINESGDIVPMFPVGVEYNEETNCLEFGSDQGMKLNQGIGLDSTLTKTGFAADAGVTGKEINSLKEDISTKITKFYASSQGETHLADSDNGKIQDMMLYGKSEQKQYSGDNIYYMDYEDYSQTYNGARITSTKFGYSVSGTFSGTSAYTLTNRYIILAPGTYKMLLKNISALKIGLSKRDYSAITTISEGKTDTTFTLDEETEVCLTIGYSNTTANETNKIMLTNNLEATSYEPYTGGVPSPTPDYPQEIKSVVNPTVKVCGKNLLNESGKVNKAINASGGFFNASDFYGYEQYIEFTNPMVFSCDNSIGSIRYALYDNNKNFIERRDSENKYIVIENTKAKYIRVCHEKTRINPRVIVGRTDSAYEPYHEQTVTLPYTLNAIPVSSGSNVTINGQQYVSDYVDVERGKLVRMVDSSKLDNTQSIIDKTEWLLAEPQEIDLTTEEITAFKALATYYPVTNISVNSEQLDGYTVFNYPISLADGWNYVKQQIGDTRDYIYDMDARTQDTDLQAAEAYVNSEYAVALTELEV